MSLSIKLLETNNQIRDKIYKSIANDVNKRIKRRSPKVRDSIAKKIPGWLYSSPEITSLTSGGQGSLAAQFGLPSFAADSAADAIVNAIVASTIIDVNAVNSRNLEGGITIKVQPDNFANLLSLPQGFVKTKSGQLHWLDWLLTRGSQMIVLGYKYVPSSDGRSGGGTMQGGGNWRVPPQFSGTVNDNFITRAFSGRNKDIELAMKELFR